MVKPILTFAFVIGIFLALWKPVPAVEKYLLESDYIPASPPVDVSGAISDHNTDTSAHADKLTASDINDTPTNGETTVAASSNSVYDHINESGLHAWIVGATSVLTLRNPIVLDEATGGEVALSLEYTTNKLTSGDDTGFLINQTDTASPGTSNLIDAQVGSASKFKVSNAGVVTFAQLLASSTTKMGFSPSVADRAATGDTFYFTGSSAQELTASSGSQVWMSLDPFYNQTGTASGTDLRINRTETAVGSGEQNLADFQVGGTSKFKVRNGGLVINTVQAVTCADSGGAGAQTATITPTSSYVEITNADADGCDITMGETGMGAGAKVDICVVSNAGTTVNFADTAGVTELAGAFAADIDDCITLRYGNTTTWREVSRSAN